MLLKGVSWKHLSNVSLLLQFHLSLFGLYISEQFSGELVELFQQN